MAQIDGELVVRTIEGLRKVLTMDEIASAMGVSRMTVYNWARGEARPYMKERGKFIKLLDKCRLTRLKADWVGED